MKKILWSAIIVLCYFNVLCQDTVTLSDSVYLIKKPYSNLVWNTAHSGHCQNYLIHKYIVDFNVELPTTVYGIAITMDTTSSTVGTLPIPGYDGDTSYSLLSDTNRFLSLKLMAKNNGKGIAKYDVIDSSSFDSHGMPPVLKSHLFQYDVDEKYYLNNEGAHIRKTCYEVYFDHPHILTDTFYVGMYDESDIYYPYDPDPTNIEKQQKYNLMLRNPKYYFALQHPKDMINNKPYYCETSATFVSYGITYNEIEVFGLDAKAWGLIFPIVKLRCRGGVNGIDLFDKGKGYARVVWAYDEWDDTLCSTELKLLK